MKDIPIIFSAPMVRALLEGRKAMTRRILNPQPVAYQNEYCTRLRFSDRKGQEIGDASPDLLSDGRCMAADFTRYAVGDRLWVRENFNPRYFDGGLPAYGADWTGESSDCVPRPKWTPCIHMPRRLSRLTLIVTDVKVERLAGISEADARAEGVAPTSLDDTPYNTYAGCFWELWAGLHGRDSVLADPWVVAVSFRVIKANIDAPEARAA